LWVRLGSDQEDHIVPILRWITILWPGLPQLWLRGQWSALGLAIGFSALVNIAILATWGWTELLEPLWMWTAWSGVVLFWLVSLFGGAGQIVRLDGVSSIDSAGDLFRAVQGEYLKGNWFEAELTLNQILERNPSDVDAHLMLATLLRRIGQPGEARERLKRLMMIEGAEKWQLEIARQLRLLEVNVDVTAQNVQLQESLNTGLPSAA
jgi:hypothetical protein